MKIKKKKWIGGILFLLILCLFLLKGLDNRVIITNIFIKDERVGQPFKALLLTDIHSCQYGENQEELLSKINKINPDIIFLSGDIIDDELPMELGFWTVEQFASAYPTYYVTGNHEYWSGKVPMIKERLHLAGAHILEGNIEAVNILGNLIQVGGIDDPDAGDEEYQRQLASLDKTEGLGIKILLAHRPERIKDYQRLDFDYVLSGHAHGGQWRIPLLLEHGLFAPNQGIFPKYTTGKYSFNDFDLIVSRGLSRETTRIPRFYNPPEMIVLEFMNK